MEARDDMTASSCSSLKNAGQRMLAGTKLPPAIITVFILLIPRLWAENLKEYTVIPANIHTTWCEAQKTPC